MNREIKFRVWDRALNKMITKENVKGLLDTVNTGDLDTDYTNSRDEWYPAYDILTIFDYFEDIEDRYIEDTSTKRFELMQYTELHDKNGKKIYEGDVVYCQTKFGKAKAIIKFIDGKFVAYWNSALTHPENGHHIACYEINKRFEVIGNVFENPELLGGKYE